MRCACARRAGGSSKVSRASECRVWYSIAPGRQRSPPAPDHPVVVAAEQAGQDRRGGRAGRPSTPIPARAAAGARPTRCRSCSGAAAGRSRSCTCGRRSPGSSRIWPSTRALASRKAASASASSRSRTTTKPSRKKMPLGPLDLVRRDDLQAAQAVVAAQALAQRHDLRIVIDPAPGARGSAAVKPSVRTSGRPSSSVVSFGGVAAHQPTSVSPKTWTFLRSITSRLSPLRPGAGYRPQVIGVPPESRKSPEPAAGQA